jgi:hypothetical protein
VVAIVGGGRRVLSPSVVGRRQSYALGLFYGRLFASTRANLTGKPCSSEATRILR